MRSRVIYRRVQNALQDKETFMFGELRPQMNNWERACRLRDFRKYGPLDTIDYKRAQRQ